jgi:hypothetical protein
VTGVSARLGAALLRVAVPFLCSDCLARSYGRLRSVQLRMVTLERHRPITATSWLRSNTLSRKSGWPLYQPVGHDALHSIKARQPTDGNKDHSQAVL